MKIDDSNEENTISFNDYQEIKNTLYLIKRPKPDNNI